MAIVGSTGSGKSTIVSLLNRLYEIEVGKISIDGMDIKEYDLETLRGNIGLVLQDVFCSMARYTTTSVLTTQTLATKRS